MCITRVAAEAMERSNYERQSEAEQALLRKLDGLVGPPRITDHLAPVIARVEQRMQTPPIDSLQVNATYK